MADEMLDRVFDLIDERDRLRRDNERMREALEVFVGKHYHCGSKANRPDYMAMVPTEDIWALREALVGDE
jgi:hypothetical protein